MFLSHNHADIYKQIQDASQRLYRTGMVSNTGDARNRP